MKHIRSFFHMTRVFWVVSRFVLGLIFSYCAIFLLEGADAVDYFIAGLFGLLALALIWNFFTGIFTGGAKKWIRVSTGIVLEVIALATFYATVDALDMGLAALILILPVWFLMAGIFELISPGNRKERTAKIKWSDVSLN